MKKEKLDPQEVNSSRYRMSVHWSGDYGDRNDFSSSVLYDIGS